MRSGTPWYERTRHLHEVVLGSPLGFTFQNRVLNAVTLCTAMATFTMFVTDLILPEAPTRYWFSFVATIVFSLLYWIGRSKNDSGVLVWSFILFCYGAIIYDFVFVGGITGNSLAFSVALAATIPMVRRGFQMFVAVVGVAAILAGLAAFEWLNPETIAQYEDRFTQIVDLYVTTVLLAGALALLVLMLVSSYRRQQDTVQSLNVSLETTNKTLSDRNSELETAAQEIRTLRGILPICTVCKKIRNDHGAYQAVEGYITQHSDAVFSHTLCPECLARDYPDELAMLESDKSTDEDPEDHPQ